MFLFIPEPIQDTTLHLGRFLFLSAWLILHLSHLTLNMENQLNYLPLHVVVSN